MPSEFISELEKEKILELMDKEFSIKKIIGMWEGCAYQKIDARKQFIISISFQKAIPLNKKELIVKTTGESLPVFHYNLHKDPFGKYYTFLVIGETGTGKTTLLDAFVNYLAGMEYTDTWRWKLVDENEFVDKNSSESQTTKITCYYINDQRNKDIQINVRIIDTPGFGDTMELSKIMKTLRNSKHHSKK